MEYLSREASNFSTQLWQQIDQTVVETAKQQLVARRFLTLHGPLGAGTAYVNIDHVDKQEEFNDGFVHIKAREVQPLTQIYQDFSILWRDIEQAKALSQPLDFSSAAYATSKIAKAEDDLILFGDPSQHIDGLFTVKDSHKIKRGDWSTGEEAFQDVAKAIGQLVSNNMVGRYALILSPELYLQLHRLQTSVGLLELDRIAKLVDGRIYPVGDYGKSEAALICCQPQYVDLAIGVDLITAYLEQKDLNHYLRIIETLALRIKEPKAIVHFQ